MISVRPSIFLQALFAAIVGLALIGSSSPVFSQEKTTIRLVLDWKFQGIHSWYYLARKKGYFAAEGLDVTIDQGEGSSASVTNVMAGTYNAGIGDVNAIIMNAAAGRPAPVMVYMLYSNPPFVINTLKKSNINSVKDLEGKSIAGPAGSAVLKLFQLVEKKQKLDSNKIKIVNIAPNLLEQILVREQVDATFQFSATSYTSFIGLNLDPDKDIGWLWYKDLGIDLYSNGLLVSRQLIEQNPKAVAGLVKAINRAIIDAYKNPDEAIAALVEQEPLINGALEKRRMQYVFKTLIIGDEHPRLGIGDIDDARMTSAIAQVAEAFDLPRKPATSEVFNRSFLPPKADRTVTP